MAENKDKNPGEAPSVSEKIDSLRKTEEGELEHDLLEDVAGGLQQVAPGDHTDNTHTDTSHTDSP